MLVEGRQTERKVYPLWLELLSPHMNKIDSPSNAVENNFFLISGEGYPKLLDVALKNCLIDIQSSGKYDSFWIVLDTDGEDMQERGDDILNRIASSGINIGDCSVEIIFQNPCIETWGLGNKSIFSKNQLHGNLNDCYHFYDVSANDPELMAKPRDYNGTIANFHEFYLKAMFNQVNMNYSKARPHALSDKNTVEGMISRINEGEHLGTFKKFYKLATLL
ncbi:RloB family protein [Enterobacter quasiroggenkampii]|uniref:RloB family protein n=1 Tax=Enterobacter quasiroggenkampii TaxID=2497436 RepID=UPI0021CFAE70|nr:RloB family protein [Enterobacter quasiroggenkampii]MCU6406609.1 RloB family protein [Enterobacter quasiroggenkampii]